MKIDFAACFLFGFTGVAVLVTQPRIVVEAASPIAPAPSAPDDALDAVRTLERGEVGDATTDASRPTASLPGGNAGT